MPSLRDEWTIQRQMQLLALKPKADTQVFKTFIFLKLHPHSGHFACGSHARLWLPRWPSNVITYLAIYQSPSLTLKERKIYLRTHPFHISSCFFYFVFLVFRFFTHILFTLSNVTEFLCSLVTRLLWVAPCVDAAECSNSMWQKRPCSNPVMSQVSFESEIIYSLTCTTDV